jgi:hypothetical protein
MWESEVTLSAVEVPIGQWRVLSLRSAPHALTQSVVEQRTTLASARDDARLARLRRLAWWLDEGIRVPGTRIRFGLDPILGLIPGLGDVAGALLGGAILMEAYRRRLSRNTLVRMAANIIVDTAAGAGPLLGDAVDFVWKSNRRNLDLLERHTAKPAKAVRTDRLWVMTVFGLLAATCVGLLVGSAFLIGATLKELAGS